MGAWDYGIKDNDVSMDAICTYEEARENGMSKIEATNYTINLLKDYVDDEDQDAADFWFGLAYIQCEYGELVDIVKKKALEFLDRSEHLELWLEAGLETYNLRLKALNELKEMLNSSLQTLKN